jgi:5-methylcytosine-specific restriction endonuclease McrA
VVSFDEDDLNYIFDKTGGECHYCGKQLAWSNYGLVGKRGAWEVDHSIPVSRGGTDHQNNLWPACVSCNTEKGTLTGSEYQRMVEGGRRQSASSDIRDIIGGIVVAGLAVLVLSALFGKPKIDAW